MIRLATNNSQNIIAKCLCQLFLGGGGGGGGREAGIKLDKNGSLTFVACKSCPSCCCPECHVTNYYPARMRKE